MSRCRDITQLVTASQDRSLSLAERTRVWWHLKFCSACSRFSRQIDFMQEAMRRYRDGLE